MQTSLKWKIAQFAEIRWWKNYLKNQTVEDYLVYKKDYWVKFIDKIPAQYRPNKGDNILDAGCGPAGVFIVMEEHQVTAVDPLLEQYESNLSHFSRARYPNTQFHTSTLEGYTPKNTCLLYPSDAADDMQSGDPGCDPTITKHTNM